MDQVNATTRVAVVGGGLVGSLAACFLSKRHFSVQLYEYREDIRKAEHVQGRSINLAMSARARAALKAVGIEEQVASEGIPMRARMIHDMDGKRWPIPYGTTHQHLLSMDRRRLNETLLTAAESRNNVKLHFDHKLTSVNSTTGHMKFKRESGAIEEATADVILGADGAFSAVRAHMMKKAHFNYSQEYIPHGYKELCMPAKSEGKEKKHAMEVNYLHIWPRGQFMMIALPNQDMTYTVTVFMPFHIFDCIGTPDQLLDFFQQYFPDSIPLIGEQNIIKDYFSVNPQPLISIKCDPFHIDRVALLGDAAHAMVPFYGQGMNCGFEDCLLLDEAIARNEQKLDLAFAEFSSVRCEDAHAICSLAMYNYIEMRDLVNSKRFLFRKKLDGFLHWVMPKSWVPLYTSVSFTRTPYKKCIENREWQDKVLSYLMYTGLLGLSMATATAILYAWRKGNCLHSVFANAFKLR